MIPSLYNTTKHTGELDKKDLETAKTEDKKDLETSKTEDKKDLETLEKIQEKMNTVSKQISESTDDKKVSELKVKFYSLKKARNEKLNN